MPYRGDVFTQGQYYHIYNRGAGKAKIFFNEGNYLYLLRLMREHALKYGAAVIAYCLMPNHYHLLLRQETEEPLSKFMQALFNAYVQALNIQQGRTGTLFEGRFKHKRVDTWEYLIILCRYIHRNPVKAGLVKKPEDWAYSNYREWIGLRNGALVDRIFVQDHFSSADEYVKFVNDVEDEEKSYGKISKYLFD
ncbi:MAG: transposase [Anaerolineae bacterium]|nr:MAG: transposase [Anaerolineae bacterium]